MAKRKAGFRRGLFVVIEGLDGCGKTTLTYAVAKELSADFDVVIVNWRDCDLGCETASSLANYIDQSFSRMYRATKNIGEDIYLFSLLTASRLSLVYCQKVLPALKDGKIVLADGWGYRLLTKYCLYNQISNSPSVQDLCFFNWLEHIFLQTLEEDVTILLDVDPKVCWDRKAGKVSEFETGRCCGLNGINMKAFIKFQTSLQKKLLDLAEKLNWSVIDGNYELLFNVKQVIDLIFLKGSVYE